MELQEGTVSTEVKCPYCDHTETIEVEVIVGDETPKLGGGHTRNVEAVVVGRHTVARQFRAHYDEAGHEA